MATLDARLRRYGFTFGFASILPYLAGLAVAKGGDPAGERAIAAYLKAEPGLIERYANVRGSGAFRNYFRQPPTKLAAEENKARILRGITGFEDIPEEVRIEQTGTFSVDGSKKSFDTTWLVRMVPDSSKLPAITWRNQVDEPGAVQRVVYVGDGEKSSATRWLKGQDTPVVSVEGANSWIPRIVEGLRAPHSVMGKPFSEIVGDPSFAVVASKEVMSQGRKCVEISFQYKPEMPGMAFQIRSGKAILSAEEGWVVHAYELSQENGAKTFTGTVKYRHDAGEAAASAPPIAFVEPKSHANRSVYEFHEFEFGKAPNRK
jgi:hypothetical protein